MGLPDKTVEKARDRVSSIIKNSGFENPKSSQYKMVVSLSLRSYHRVLKLARTIADINKIDKV